MDHPNPWAARAAAARAAIADPARITTVGMAATEGAPRFELFHAASSLCSQKVRTVLAEKRLPYRSSEMAILGHIGPDGLVMAEHYDPAYVRMRLEAGRALGQAFVSGYSGRTAVETEGFDPCVVPLLIDHQAGRAIVDSLAICLYLDAVSPYPLQLLPEAPATRAAVLHQIGIVDRIPNGALLYGFHPDADDRPTALKEVMATVYELKILALERLVAVHAGDAELVAAYRAKIAKESGGRQVRRDAAFQRAARLHVQAALAQLEQDLATEPFSLLDRGGFTLADALWGVNLVRMTYLGLVPLWDGLPRVRAYADALVHRPSLCREAVQASLESMPPSNHMQAVAGC